MVDVEVVLSM